MCEQLSAIPDTLIQLHKQIQALSMEEQSVMKENELLEKKIQSTNICISVKESEIKRNQSVAMAKKQKMAGLIN